MPEIKIDKNERGILAEINGAGPELAEMLCSVAENLPQEFGLSLITAAITYARIAGIDIAHYNEIMEPHAHQLEKAQQEFQNKG